MALLVPQPQFMSKASRFARNPKSQTPSPRQFSILKFQTPSKLPGSVIPAIEGDRLLLAAGIIDPGSNRIWRDAMWLLG
jgi:hypothetical protein